MKPYIVVIDTKDKIVVSMCKIDDECESELIEFRKKPNKIVRVVFDLNDLYSELYGNQPEDS